MHATWAEFLNIVRDQVGSRVVETWFKAIVFTKWDSVANEAYLVAPNAFVRDWVKKNYMPLIQLNLGRLLHVDMPRVIVDTAQSELPNESLITAPPSISVMPASVVDPRHELMKSERQRYGNLNKNYSFENFIVGPNNSLAYAAAHAITQAPGRCYNPLFMYGKSGLGKTHLLHAIGNEIKSHYHNAVVLYQTADRFVTEFISAIRFNKVHKFQQKYHSIDVLLVDDLQFISRKEHTQEAFFHIFNALYEARKQIVFSSDVYPQDIEGIADRLRSRLSCGLVTDIYMPSLETKIAILKKKASLSGEQLDDMVAHFIASAVTSNIRELEGALIRVMAFATLTKQPVTSDLAKKVLQRAHISQSLSPVGLAKIVNHLTKYYPYSFDDLCSKQRSKEITHVRHIAMFLMKKLTDKSLRDIGNFLGGRDHSTVMHGLQKIEAEMQEEPVLRDKVHSIEKEILAQ
jgi:chromosomal replication initiator protein